MAIKYRKDHFCLSGLFHLLGMGKILFGQRCPDNRGSTVLLLALIKYMQGIVCSKVIEL